MPHLMMIRSGFSSACWASSAAELYGVLTGGTVESGWERFYRLVNERNVSLTRAAVSGLSAHLLLDFTGALAEVVSISSGTTH